MSISGLIASASPLANPSALNKALLIGRGGATIIAASTAASIIDPAIRKLRGGAGKAAQLASPTSKGLSLPPEAKSVLCMATGMSLHYFGYSLARAITVSLFTSSSTGYAGIPFAFPLAMTFVSPVSLLLLMGYGRVLERRGPKGALRWSTLFCASVIAAASLAMAFSEQTGATFFGIPAMKFITGPLFIFRESYVQLLTSQYWSFMASVLSPNQSAKWFAPISGLTSISSAIGGVGVSSLADKINLSGALFCATVSLVLSLFATNAGYSIAEKNGFDPSDNPKHKSKVVGKQSKTKTGDDQETGLIKKATTLFQRVPVLWALFLEILASQGLVTLLNVCFVHSLSSSITDDHVRAGWIGNFYALINIISMVLQFGVLPFLMQKIEPKALWRFIPAISLALTTFQALQRNPSLNLVSASLLTMKVLEYSARRMLDEMVYVPLDFESRFVGKEIIGVFGYRFGKSIMSLSLSGLTSAFGSFNLQQLSILCGLAALAWAKTAWHLSSLVPTRGEAQAAYAASHTVSKKKK